MHTAIYKGHLNLFLNDDKLICCKGHLEHADLPVSSKNPVILPTKHHFTELLIQEKHQLVLHNDIQETLLAIREGYWIVRGREHRKCSTMKQAVLSTELFCLPRYFWDTQSSDSPVTLTQ